jgi:hypothetical protein
MSSNLIRVAIIDSIRKPSAVLAEGFLIVLMYKRVQFRVQFPFFPPISLPLLSSIAWLLLHSVL